MIVKKQAVIKSMFCTGIVIFIRLNISSNVCQKYCLGEECSGDIKSCCIKLYIRRRSTLHNYSYVFNKFVWLSKN